MWLRRVYAAINEIANSVGNTNVKVGNLEFHNDHADATVCIAKGVRWAIEEREVNELDDEALRKLIQHRIYLCLEQLSSEMSQLCASVESSLEKTGEGL